MTFYQPAGSRCRYDVDEAIEEVLEIGHIPAGIWVYLLPREYERDRLRLVNRYGVCVDIQRSNHDAEIWAARFVGSATAPFDCAWVRP